MKRLIAVLLSVIMLFVLLCGCKGTDTVSSDISTNSYTENSSLSVEIYREHQELTASEIEFEDNDMLRVSIPEVGLENVFIRDISNSEKLYDGVFGKVYLIADDRHGGSRMPADNYLVVVTYDKLFIKDVTDCAAYSAYIELCDIDGDEDAEILLQENVSMTGGYGNYLTRIFDFKDGQIKDFYSFNNGDVFAFDTGYSIKLLENKEFKIENKFTGYSETFVDKRSNKDDEYYRFWYDVNGELSNRELWVDPFYEVLPIDFDNDGVYEILCRQYVCLCWHNDGLGTATTILKYDNDADDFNVIDSKFENFIF